MEMTKKWVKATAVMIALVAIVMSMRMVTYASTIDFSLRVTADGSNQDNISRRTVKAGGSRWDNKAYTRATSFPIEGTIWVRSIMRSNHNVFTPDMGMSTGDLGILQYAEYNATATANKYYYLSGRYGVGNENVLTVAGRYTP